jgi:lipopolysaccharide transport system ATP-binding protein
MSLAIKVEQLSKVYRLGQFSTGTLSRDLERWWAMMRGKEDPMTSFDDRQILSIKPKEEVIWSLRDVSFEVEQGTSVGIIGRNGAGKSTLLKILSRVTSPTQGKVSIRGRVASLLEVGTGFHPELTGRENVFLNGTILGMSRKEIRNKFDEIIDFAALDKFVDTPVKRYSSGMYVRLAFAVAAHLDSEILVVDEVLAVGDASFQKKCIGKMNEVSRNQGRTVLFVSHNMASIKALCSHSVVLMHGKVEFTGATDQGISEYLRACNEDARGGDEPIEYSEEKGGLMNAFFSKSETRNTEFLFGEKINISMKWDFPLNLNARVISMRIHNPAGELVCGYNTLHEKFVNQLDNTGKYEIIFEADGGIAPGSYTIDIGTFIRPHTREYFYPAVMAFDILDIPHEPEFIPNIVGDPKFYTRSGWEIKQVTS